MLVKSTKTLTSENDSNEITQLKIDKNEITESI